MEITSIRQLLPHVGEEKYQMLELNRRLESYLGRVKMLEEENQLLRGEIQALRRKGNTKGQKQIQEEALHQARREVQAAWMEKDRVEMEVCNLVEEIEALNAQRQKEKSAQAEAKRKLSESKKKLEDEWRTQIWLREQAAHLEKEVTMQVQVHEEEMESLKSTTVLTKSVLMPPQSKQTFSLRELGEDYSQRAAQAWQEAASVYQRQVEQLEDSLNQTRVSMTQINQEKKENKLYLQDLAKEMESSKVKRDLLEKNMDQQRNRQNQELQKLQDQVEGLEAEKVDLREQIDDLLVDRRNLLQMKICLGLEVATYRALLDSESLRVNSQSPVKTSSQTVSILEALPKPHRTHSGTQATSVSSHFSSQLTTTSRSITPTKADLMTSVLSRNLTQSSRETHKRVLMTEREKTGISGETTKFERTSTSASTRSFSGTGSVPFTTKEAMEVNNATAISAPVVHLTTGGPGSIPSSHVEEDLQEIPIANQSKAGPDTSGTEGEATLISQLPTGHPSSLPQTPEREVPYDRHTEDTRGSDEGEDEETEVSTEMAQISHAPMFAWEENDTAVPEEKDVVPELELESQAIHVNYTQQCSVEATLADLQQLDENSDNLASPSFEDLSLPSIDVINYGERNLALVDVTERVSSVSKEESLESEAVIENAPIESYERMHNRIKEMEDEILVDHCGNKAQEGHHSKTELHEVENRTNSESEEQTWEETMDEKMTEVNEDKKEIEKVEEDDVAFLNKSLTNTGKQVMVKDPSDQETEVNLHRNFKPDEQVDELVMDTDKHHMLEENHAEENKSQSDEDEESLNISASWRTDPGDADTLADTRPLIHYKSDDEADANTQASHFGISEPSDSEDEREKHEVALMWGQNAAKRFDTMEDLSEEPEIITSDDIVVDKSAQTLVEENFDEMSNGEPLEPVEADDLQSKSDDLDISVNTLKDDALMDQAVNDFMLSEESNERAGLAIEEKTVEKIYQIQELLVQKQDLSLESDDLDISVNTLKDDALMDQAVNDFRLCEESNESVGLAREDKINKINQVQDLLVHKQNESLFTRSQDMSLESFLSETRDITEQRSIDEEDSTIAQSVVEENIDEIPNKETVELVDDDSQSKSHSQDWSQGFFTETMDISEQPREVKYDTTISQYVAEENNGVIPINEYVEPVDDEDHQNKSHSQDWSQSFFNETSEQPTTTAQTHLDNFPLITDSTPLSEEASQEEAIEDEPCEMPPEPTEASHSDAFPLETKLTKEKSCAKEEEDEQSNPSMLTQADFTDNLSLHSEPNSRPDSQTNIDHSDLEESNSSEDESPNNSQCSQLLSQLGISTKELDSSNAATVVEASKDQDTVTFTGFMEEAMVKSFGEDCFVDNSPPQTAEEWENVSQNQEEQDEHQLAVENNSSGMNEDASSVPQMQECENLDLDHPDNVTGASHNILSTVEDFKDLENDKALDKLDIFQDNVLNEEPKEKENDPHSFFSSSIKEDIWNMTKFEMAATYDSHEPTETERYSPDTLLPNQSMAFGENWGEMGNLKPTNGKPEKEISTGPQEEEEVEEEREEQDMPKAKQPHSKDAKDGVAVGVQSDDSIEEGDSWSSGEE